MSIQWISMAVRATCLGGVFAVSTAPTFVAAEGAQILQTAASHTSVFNWLANGNVHDKSDARARQIAARASYMSARGGASWICTPAGFGRKSHCRRG